MITAFVAIVMGSDSDLPVMQNTIKVLRECALPFEGWLLSAHRTPQATRDYVRDADQRGCKVFICVAGLAAPILAACDEPPHRKLCDERDAKAAAVLEKNARLQEQLAAEY